MNLLAIAEFGTLSEKLQGSICTLPIVASFARMTVRPMYASQS